MWLAGKNVDQDTNKGCVREQNWGGILACGYNYVVLIDNPDLTAYVFSNKYLIIAADSISVC